MRAKQHSFRSLFPKRARGKLLLEGKKEFFICPSTSSAGGTEEGTRNRSCRSASNSPTPATPPGNSERERGTPNKKTCFGACFWPGKREEGTGSYRFFVRGVCVHGTQTLPALLHVVGERAKKTCVHLHRKEEEEGGDRIALSHCR